MQVWSLSPSGGHNAVATAGTAPRVHHALDSTHAVRGADAAAGLIDCVARQDFGLRTLNRLNRTLPVAWWSVFRVYADRPPTLCALGCFEVPDIALECFRIYQAGPYRHDSAFLTARDQAGVQPAGHAALAHCVADDFGSVHREQIYQRHGLSERLSVVSSAEDAPGDGDGSGELLAINLYRHRAQPLFSATEIDTVFDLAAPLTAVVRRHLELTETNDGAARATHATAAIIDHDAETVGSGAVEHLRQRCPALTEREMQVCERLLRGWTFEGIAVDLGLSSATVKTYRNRAFDRLGIHFRNELFGLALSRGPASQG